jgi:Uma2 family endonuclease
MECWSDELCLSVTFSNLPENGLRYQLIEGELYIAPAPNLYHQSVSGNLEFILRSYLQQNPVAILFDAPGDVFFDRASIWQPGCFPRQEFNGPDPYFEVSPRRGIATKKKPAQVNPGRLFLS